MRLGSFTIAGSGYLVAREMDVDRCTALVDNIPPDLTYLKVNSASRMQPAN